MNNTLSGENTVSQRVAQQAVFPVLFALSFSHLLNDTMQSLIPSIYPLVKDSFRLDFAQIGLITLTFQLSASILQPFVGFYTDKKPQPYALAIGMGFTLLGLLLLSQAASFSFLLFSVALVGMGSAVFHPEASRMAHLASGGRRGMAQSLFQLGGNAGSSLGPILAALVIVPFGQVSIGWFSGVALLAILVLWRVGRWQQNHTAQIRQKAVTVHPEVPTGLSRSKIILSLVILLTLIFSKHIYLSSMTSYFTFYLIDKFGVSVQSSQMYLFVFLFSVAAGTFIGGPVGDRFGRKYVIWGSILGVAPFTLLLPHANLFWTGVLIVLIGVILSSAFSAILVYAQELVPGKIGLIAGLFFGFAFGVAGIGSAVLGEVADRTSIGYVFQLCAFLPLIGLLTGFLPDVEKSRKA
ncbi:fosmidomycin resistance protein [Adhaeribacter aerolatus]|uniref:Fosmidomycin resistance protein n=1 Tax=Adhaeribacter aerolatus TaxID=670289 RepID=A0A512B2F0_9BACT|nr:MFS transporter [Adhaeribacter aerolatus]GEO06142.1 fosmidomycin resistance protein [Adhaeribacter aerolatus]